MDDHPLAAAYFIPAAASAGKFDMQVYQDQLAEQIRTRKAPAQFWQEAAYNAAAAHYFAALDMKNQQIAAAGNNSAMKSQIDQDFTNWSQQFMQVNPLFAKQLSDTNSGYNRADVLTQIQAALQDPRLPLTQ